MQPPDLMPAKPSRRRSAASSEGHSAIRGPRQPSAQPILERNHPMSHFHRAAPAAFALCAALAIGTTAAAAQVAVSGDADQVIRKVAYSDADLHTVDGARSLAQRVRVA